VVVVVSFSAPRQGEFHVESRCVLSGLSGCPCARAACRLHASGLAGRTVCRQRYRQRKLLPRFHGRWRSGRCDSWYDRVAVGVLLPPPAELVLWFGRHPPRRSGSAAIDLAIGVCASGGFHGPECLLSAVFTLRDVVRQACGGCKLDRVDDVDAGSSQTVSGKALREGLSVRVRPRTRRCG